MLKKIFLLSLKCATKNKMGPYICRYLLIYVMAISLPNGFTSWEECKNIQFGEWIEKTELTQAKYRHDNNKKSELDDCTTTFTLNHLGGYSWVPKRFQEDGYSILTNKFQISQEGVENCVVWWCIKGIYSGRLPENQKGLASW